MKLIADSGSSRTEWRLIDAEGRIRQAETLGLNPFHVTDEAIIRELEQSLIPKLAGNDFSTEKVSEIYFYGSGCVVGNPVERIKQNLEHVFPHAIADVNDDLLAVGRGLCGKDTGIVAILGTGANSGLYNGKEFIEKVRALGYILGDEGSGAWIGRTLLAAYLRNELPKNISERLEKRFELTPGEILEKVYRTPGASRYLASFSRFVFQNLKEPRLYQIVYEGFRLFMEHNILKYSKYKKTPVHFSGSVAFYYANILRQVAADLGIHIGHIVEGPVAGLALYHKQSIITS